MRSAFTAMTCRALVVALLLLPIPGQASMIGTDVAATTSSVQADRNAVSTFLSRAQTVSELQSLGVDPKAARDRVAAMTDAEAASLAGQIHALPAGGDGIVLLILVVFIIWYFALR